MQSPEPAAAGQPTHIDARLPYLPGLDGLRALAVIAVVLYHAGLNVRGGFLGVESFFVLSGYLITALLGAALALVWTPGHLPWTGRRSGRALDLAGPLALCVVLVLYRMMNDRHPLLYPYGLALVTLASGVVIAAAAHPEARLIGRLLGFPTLHWIGQRSYGIYLWHWPLLMLTRPYVDVPLGGWPLLALQFAAMLLLADASYRLVEIPIRRGALGPAWQRGVAWLHAHGAAVRARARRLAGFGTARWSR